MSSEPAAPARTALIERLDTLAKAKGLGLDSVATEVGVSLNTLRGWLRGIYAPTKASRERIDAFLDRKGAPESR